MVRVRDLCDAAERIAPVRFAESWDNVGLLLGDRSAEVAPRLLVTIDLTDAVVAEAVELGVGAVVSYHPPIFHGLKRLTADTREGRMVLELARAGVCVYAPHTALDAAPGGLAEWLLERAAAPWLDPKTVRPIAPSTSGDSAQSHKLVTFVPADAVERVSAALSEAGAGVIGDYTGCTFQAAGTGTFLGGASTNPAVGERGKLEHAPEIRLETVCSARTLPEVIAALRDAHPYEEPAFDLFRRDDVPELAIGLGRRCELGEPVAAEALADRLREELGVRSVRLAQPDAPREITRVAVCPGSGASLFRDSGLLSRGEGLLLVTGEMSHHEVLGSVTAGASVVLAGHTNTERGYLPILAERLRAELAGVEVLVSERDRWPLVERGAESA